MYLKCIWIKILHTKFLNTFYFVLNICSLQIKMKKRSIKYSQTFWQRCFKFEYESQMLRVKLIYSENLNSNKQCKRIGTNFYTNIFFVVYLKHEYNRRMLKIIQTKQCLTDNLFKFDCVC